MQDKVSFSAKARGSKIQDSGFNDLVLYDVIKQFSAIFHINIQNGGSKDLV